MGCTCAILWVICAILYFGSQIVQTLSLKYLTVNTLCNHHKHFYMPPCWIFSFQNFKFVTFGRVKRVNVRHGAKFRGDPSNRWWDMAIFQFFKTAFAAILDFQNLDSLTVERVKRANMRHCASAKFCDDRSNSFWDMSVAIFFDFSKMAAVSHRFVMHVFRPPWGV